MKTIRAEIRGWLQYCGRFYRSALYPPMRQLDPSLGALGLPEIQEAARAFARGDSGLFQLIQGAKLDKDRVLEFTPALKAAYQRLDIWGL